MTTSTFDEYVATLSAVAPEAASQDPQAFELCARATAAIASFDRIDRDGLARLVEADPEILLVLAAAADLSQERFKTWLQLNFATAGWISLGRQRPSDVVDAMDEQLALVTRLAEQASREWTWADVLPEGCLRGSGRAAPWHRAEL